jgi:hypothetical protein
VKAVEDHNAARWLEIAWLDHKPRPYDRQLFSPGWYVVRRCPCHHGEPVTLSLPSETAAWRAMRMMLRVTAARERA